MPKAAAAPEPPAAPRAATIHDLVANPFYVDEASASESERAAGARDQWARELYEHNLRELTRMMNGGRAMWCVRLNAVGAIEESRRCRASDRAGRDCFTLFIPGQGGTPRFGHPNNLNPSQMNVYPIMKADALTIATAQERAHTAQRDGLLTPEAAEATLAELRGRFDALPPSKSALDEAAQREAAAAAAAERERERRELQAADDEMPSFEGLVAAFRDEDAGGAAAGAAPAAAGGRAKARRRGRRRK